MKSNPSPLLTEFRSIFTLIEKSDQEIAALEADGEKWRREKKDLIHSGAVTDDRKIRLVSTLDTKLSMLPFALEKARAVRPNIIAIVDRRAGEVLDAALAILDRVETEAVETIRANVGLFVADAAEVDLIVLKMLAWSEIGRRLACVAGCRLNPPIRDLGHVSMLIHFLASAEELAAQWEEAKENFGKLPATPFESAA